MYTVAAVRPLCFRRNLSKRKRNRAPVRLLSPPSLGPPVCRFRLFSLCHPSPCHTPLALCFPASPVLVKCEASDEGWKLVSTLFGVKVWSKPNADAASSRVMCRGQMPLSPGCNLGFLQAQFVKAFNNTEALAQEMKISDPMSRETKILYQVPMMLL